MHDTSQNLKLTVVQVPEDRNMPKNLADVFLGVTEPENVGPYSIGLQVEGMY